MAPEELTFEFKGWSRFDCLEVDGTHLNLDPALIRQDYLEAVRGFLSGLKRLCGECGCDYHPLPTDRALGDGLAVYLRQRAARLKVT